jgi:hypothetical protein
LDALNFSWGLDDRWTRFITELKKFKAEHGHCRVPKNTPLGEQCVGRRRARKRGQLTDDQIAELTALDFCWDVIEADRQKFLAELTKFKAEHGHCNVPRDTPLGRQCRTVYFNRKIEEAKKGGLSERWKKFIAELDALGFPWATVVPKRRVLEQR